jgi:MaoC dehydratase-like protein
VTKDPIHSLQPRYRQLYEELLKILIELDPLGVHSTDPNTLAPEAGSILARMREAHLADEVERIVLEELNRWYGRCQFATLDRDRLADATIRCGVPNIHTDRAVACESGLSGPIAQGLMSTGYLSQLLVDFFGIDWFKSGWTSHAFIRPVSPGDTLTVNSRIQDKQVEANGTRLVLEVWCHNQTGELTIVGTARTLVTS